VATRMCLAQHGGRHSVRELAVLPVAETSWDFKSGPRPQEHPQDRLYSVYSACILNS
jgi:hypothetical protein